MTVQLRWVRHGDQADGVSYVSVIERVGGGTTYIGFLARELHLDGQTEDPGAFWSRVRQRLPLLVSPVDVQRLLLEVRQVVPCMALNI